MCFRVISSEFIIFCLIEFVFDDFDFLGQMSRNFSVICDDCHLHFWCAFHIFSLFYLCRCAHFGQMSVSLIHCFFSLTFVTLIEYMLKSRWYVVRTLNMVKVTHFLANAFRLFFSFYSLFFFTLISSFAVPQFQIKVFSQRFYAIHGRHFFFYFVPITTTVTVILYALLSSSFDLLLLSCIHKCLFWRNSTVFSLINILYLMQLRITAPFSTVRYLKFIKADAFFRFDAKRHYWFDGADTDTTHKYNFNSLNRKYIELNIKQQRMTKWVASKYM